MSVRSVMAAVLKSELALRGVNSLTPRDCEEIVGQLIQQIAELELNLAAPEPTTPRRRS